MSIYNTFFNAVIRFNKSFSIESSLCITDSNIACKSFKVGSLIACDKVSIAFREHMFLASMLCPLGKHVAGTQLSEQKKNTSCQLDVQTRMSARRPNTNVSSTSKHECQLDVETRMSARRRNTNVSSTSKHELQSIFFAYDVGIISSAKCMKYK